MRVIAIGGEPATGKSTLMRQLLPELGKGFATFTYQGKTKIRGTVHREAKVVVLGLYGGGETFEGTDKFSMACQPDVCSFFRMAKQMDSGYHDHVVVFEGDRLFNRKMIDWLAAEKIQCDVLVLEASGAAKDARHRARADTQTTSWLAGRATKVENVATYCRATRHRHETAEDTDLAVKFLLGEIKLGERTATTA